MEISPMHASHPLISDLKKQVLTSRGLVKRLLKLASMLHAGRGVDTLPSLSDLSACCSMGRILHGIQDNHIHICRDVTIRRRRLKVGRSPARYVTTTETEKDIPTTINVQSPRHLDDVSLSGSGSGSSSPGSPIIEVVPGAAYRPGSMVDGDPGARMVLEQTELVYDQLLAERQAKLHRRIEDKRRQFQEKIEELGKTDAQKATEFKRWSDAALVNMEKNCASEMRRLREDYEAKFARLERSLVQQCRHSMTQSRPTVK